LVLAIGIVITHSVIRARADRRDVQVLILLVLFGSILRVVGAEGPVYYGNEYEDSYEYVTSADLLRWNDTRWRLFYNPTCLVGANIGCQLAGVTSHPIGFASLIAAISHQGTDATAVGIGLSGAAHVLTLVPLYLAALVSTRSRVASAAAVIVFVTLPIGALYALAPMDGAVSVLLASVAVLLWLLLVECGDSEDLLTPGALALVVIATVLVRRDHLVLLAALPLAALVSGYRRIQVLRRALPLLVAGLLIWMLLDPASSGMETTDSYVSRFGVRYFIDLLPKFVWSLSRFDWYVGVPALAGLALVFGIGQPAVRFWGVLALGYLALFCAFDHGYYYPRTGEVSEAHVGRYMVQCLPALSVLAGIGAEQVRNFMHRRLRLDALATDGTLAILTVIWVGIAVWQHHGLRRERVVFEQSYRIEPTKRIARLLPAGAVVVTIEPLLLHMVSKGKIFAVNLAALDSQITISGVVAKMRVDEVFYIRRGECVGIDRERYLSGCRQLEELYSGRPGVERIAISDTTELVRIPVELAKQ
jgi:hypothetical protein